MKLSKLIEAWEILHQKDTGEMGFCDMVDALEAVGVDVENDCKSLELLQGSNYALR